MQAFDKRREERRTVFRLLRERRLAFPVFISLEPGIKEFLQTAVRENSG